MNISAPTTGRNHTEDVHRHNLSVLLTAVHHSGGLPRARLTELSGLNRSTTAALVSELVATNLVIEAEVDSREGVGRPSRYVRPSVLPVALAVNPEVDAMTLGIVGMGGHVFHRVRRKVAGEHTVDAAIAAAASMIRELDVSGHRVVGVGAAIPGQVRRSDGVVRLAPHLGWVDAPFARLLEDAVGLPVHAANDASVGADAEGTFGAGRGINDLVYLNGGASGIGGGIISGRRPLGGSASYAGELGHTLVHSDGIVCHCGATGCLETEVRRAPLLKLVGLRDEESDQLGQALLDSTSDAVHEEVSRQLGFLGITLRNAVNTLNPERIVLGGFLAALYAAAPEKLWQSRAAQPLAASGESVSIVPAELGSDILMVGAAELAFSGLLADPTTFA
ncbi:MAG: ROK family protein [Terrimesophilobacter sp.]